MDQQKTKSNISPNHFAKGNVGCQVKKKNSLEPDSHNENAVIKGGN